MTKLATISATESIGPGTIVTLKTGGPAMVVVERTSTKVNVVWHDEDGHIHDFWVPAIAVKVKP